MTITREEVREWADSFVTKCVLNIPHEEETERLSEMGVDEGMLRDILWTHGIFREGNFATMTVIQFHNSCADATDEIVEAAADALGELMEG